MATLKNVAWDPSRWHHRRAPERYRIVPTRLGRLAHGVGYGRAELARRRGRHSGAISGSGLVRSCYYDAISSHDASDGSEFRLNLMPCASGDLSRSSRGSEPEPDMMGYNRNVVDDALDCVQFAMPPYRSGFPVVPKNS